MLVAVMMVVVVVMMVVFVRWSVLPFVTFCWANATTAAATSFSSFFLSSLITYIFV